jgi:hypothetical protein
MAAWEALPAPERQQRQAQGVAAWRQWATDRAAQVYQENLAERERRYPQ